jgi:hypothetical protein
MAINYTYPSKGSPSTADEFLIIDSVDNSTKKVTVANVLALGGGGSGGTGTVSQITFDSPLTGGIITTTGTVGLGVVGIDNGGTGKGGLLSSTRSQVLAVNAGRTGYDFVDQQVIETIEADEPLSKGDPLYVVGWNNGTSMVIVGKADSAQGSKMPCVGVAANDIEQDAVGEMIVVGVIDNIATNNLPGSPSVGDIVYVKTGGGLTGIKPDQGNLIQNIGIILNLAGAGSGSIQITATGRSNDIPNIPSSQVWVGSSAGVATPRTLTGEVTISNTGVTEVTGIDGNVSIQGYRPIVTVTSDSKTLSTTDVGKYINFEGQFGGSNSKILTLPSSSEIENYEVGTEIEVVNNSTPSGVGQPQPTLTVRVDLGSNPGTINGTANIVLTAKYASATLKLISKTSNLAVWHARVIQ